MVNYINILYNMPKQKMNESEKKLYWIEVKARNARNREAIKQNKPQQTQLQRWREVQDQIKRIQEGMEERRIRQQLERVASPRPRFKHRLLLPNHAFHQTENEKLQDKINKMENVYQKQLDQERENPECQETCSICMLNKSLNNLSCCNNSMCFICSDKILKCCPFCRTKF
jgi:uncharacterized protein YigA (DUF484 family)